MHIEFLSMANKIVLWGYMGSGKSTVGQALATQIDYPFVDLDTHLEEEHSQSIASLFQSHGAIGFRKIEQEALQQVLKMKSSMVISLGGGTPCYFDQADILAQHPEVHVFYLKYSPKVLSERLFQERLTRPLIAHLETQELLEEFVAKHLFERSSFYDKAHHTVVCDQKAVEQLVLEIKAFLHQ